MMSPQHKRPFAPAMLLTDSMVLLHLLRAGWNAERLETLLYRRSGLAGIGDLRSTGAFPDSADHPGPPGQEARVGRQDSHHAKTL